MLFRSPPQHQLSGLGNCLVIRVGSRQSATRPLRRLIVRAVAEASSVEHESADQRKSSEQRTPPSAPQEDSKKRRQRNKSKGPGQRGRGAGQQRQQQQQQQQQEEERVASQPVPADHKCGYVTIIGRPNAGKSTLQNALVGQKLSIVTRKAQTTRHRVIGIDSEEGYQMVLLDTPGVIQTITNKLDKRMMDAVRNSIEAADAVLVIVDASSSPEEVLPMVQPGAEYAGPPMAVVLNKVDLVSSDEVARLTAMFSQASAAVKAVLPCSALSNRGVASVKDWAVDQLPLGPALYDKDYISEHPERFFVAEIVREQVFLQYRQEVPYACTVLCTDFKERPPPAKDFVQVVVYVERDSQRGIVLGKGGSALKKLATASRASIEVFVGRPVYLELTVKVRENWRKDDKSLEALGY